jgi:hypothetical protein
MTVERPFHITHKRHGQQEFREGPEEAPVPGHVPRVARLMALAIRFDHLIRDGVVADYAELARLGHVTRSRMSQIMNLLNLAPEIQETILFLEPVSGRERITERNLRRISTEINWRKQRKMWRALPHAR